MTQPTNNLDNWFDADAEAQQLYDLLYDELLTVYQVGGADGLIKLAKLRQVVGVDWTQINEAAASWAEKYTYDLVRQITETTAEQLQQAVGLFFRERGMTRAQLERMILQGPGGVTDLTLPNGRIIPASRRAEWIAVTETTRAYTEGEIAAAGETGMLRHEPTDKPPKHVGCRCDITPAVRDDGSLTWRWQTLNDDKVCELCLPLHDKDVGAA
jgi:hypothetical protein